MLTSNVIVSGIWSYHLGMQGLSEIDIEIGYVKKKAENTSKSIQAIPQVC